MPPKIDDTATVAQLASGYRIDDEIHTCLFCGRTTRQGHVYRCGDDLLDAEHAMRHHIDDAHGSPFDALLTLGKKGTGLSDVQRAMLDHFHAGLTDKEIQALAGVSLSTVRNHRFALREKARQARVFLAMMELMERGDQDPGSRFIDIPGHKAADDERFAITRSEFARIVRANFPDGPDGRLDGFPKKQKHKIAVLIQILKRFDTERRYTQTEVNEVLASAWEDYTTLCRYMVDYGFLGRTRDGSAYWVE